MNRQNFVTGHASNKSINDGDSTAHRGFIHKSWRLGMRFEDFFDLLLFGPARRPDLHACSVVFVGLLAGHRLDWTWLI
jgi:hypothetical protein